MLCQVWNNEGNPNSLTLLSHELIDVFSETVNGILARFHRDM